MATTHIHRNPTPSEQRAYQRGLERGEERSSYAAVWGILAVAILAAIAYGYYTSDELTAESTVPIVRTDTTSSMVGTGTAGDELTPSTVAPGTPDTTTTESTVVPADGIE